VPNSDVIEKHARRLVEAKLTRQAMEDIRIEIEQQAADAALPGGLRHHVSALLRARPKLSWDTALAAIIGDE
jgi:hypothetical protein